MFARNELLTVTLYRLDEIGDRQPVKQWTVDAEKYEDASRIWRQDSTKNVTGASELSNDGRWLAVSQSEKEVELWQLSNIAKRLFTIVDEETITDFDFSRSGRFLAVAGKTKGTRVWDLSNDNPQGKETSLEKTPEQLTSFEFSSDELFLIRQRTRELTREKLRWKIDSGKLASSDLNDESTWWLSPPETVIHSYQPEFSVNSLLPGIRAFNRPKTFESNADQLSDLTATVRTKDGRRVITGHNDGSIRIWDLSSEVPASTFIKLPTPGRLQRELGRLDSLTVMKLELSRDEKQLIVQRGEIVSLSEQTRNVKINSVETWDIGLSHLLEQARKIVGREFTPEQRQRFSLDILNSSAQ